MYKLSSSCEYAESDAVRLDMAILDPDGVVAIDFNRGDQTDV
ncbi:hypothetical protein [Halosolutus halophilus]|nr:hypothetical protein [Halosolutus halophilus]